jgi:hypothetical protein
MYCIVPAKKMNEAEGRYKQENDRNKKQQIEVGFDVLTALTVMFPISWNLGSMHCGRCSPIFWRNTLLPSSHFKIRDVLMKHQARRCKLSVVYSCKTSVNFNQIAPPHDPEINTERI